MTVDREAIEARLTAASTGEWKAERSDCQVSPEELIDPEDWREQWWVYGPHWVDLDDDGLFFSKEDAELFVHCRADLLALLDELADKDARIEEVVIQRDSNMDAWHVSNRERNQLFDENRELREALTIIQITGDPYAPIRCDEFPENPGPGNLAMKGDVLYCWSPGGGWREVPPHTFGEPEGSTE